MVTALLAALAAVSLAKSLNDPQPLPLCDTRINIHGSKVTISGSESGGAEDTCTGVINADGDSSGEWYWDGSHSLLEEDFNLSITVLRDQGALQFDWNFFEVSDQAGNPLVTLYARTNGSGRFESASVCIYNQCSVSALSQQDEELVFTIDMSTSVFQNGTGLGGSGSIGATEVIIALPTQGQIYSADSGMMMYDQLRVRTGLVGTHLFSDPAVLTITKHSTDPIE